MLSAESSPPVRALPYPRGWPLPFGVTRLFRVRLALRLASLLCPALTQRVAPLRFRRSYMTFGLLS